MIGFLSNDTVQLRATRAPPLSVQPGAIIGAGDRKSWDARGPMIWDNFSIFRTNCAILTSYIHARVVVSRVNVVTLPDQILRITRFSCGFFTAMTGNKEPGLFYVLLCIKDFVNLGHHFPCATSAKILAAPTRVCRRRWRNLF